MSSDQTKNIYIVDDHDMLQIGLKNFLETKTDSKVIGSAKNIEKAKVLLNSQLPDLIIIDVELDTENGFELAEFIKKSYPAVKIIMYSMHDESDYIRKAKELGIDGYISKASDSEEFLHCINDIFSGKTYIEERLVESQKIIDEALCLLTKRESLIFHEMIQGKSNAEIGKTLNLSKHSVEVYATTIYEKTFCENRTDFLAKYRLSKKK